MMASTPTPQASAHRDMKHAEKAKEREFYRYYHHPHRSQCDILTDAPPTACSPARDTLPPPHSLTPADDKALTAFAQLGALRLKARRGLISFFDRRSCYILAEATPSLSLQTGKPQNEEDQLYWGRCVYPKPESICYYTANLPADASADPFDVYSQIPSLVVSDLTLDSRFVHFPTVIKGQAKFYAGVPIRSPNGHNIGAYCVLDDKPRDGVSDEELIFLKDMALTVMRHLELTRAVDDYRRGGVMVRSLGSFADGKSNLEDWPHAPWDAEQSSGAVQEDDMTLSLPRRRRRRTSSVGASTAPCREPVLISQPSENEASLPSSLASPHPASPGSVLGDSTAVTPASDLLFDPAPSLAQVKSASSAVDDPDQATLSPEVRALFDRAASIMREATEANGAVFFDAKVSTFGGLVDDEFIPEPVVESPEQDKPCTVLGLSTSNCGSRASPGNPNVLYQTVLRHLLRTYPHGQIFNFDDDASWDNQNVGEANVADIPSALSETLAATAGPLKRPESAKSQDDENLLKEVFPSARTLVLYPLWATHRDRWFAGAIIWSSDPMRVFTNEQELSYVAAFSNSIMAEVARLDIKLADAAKGDFISSISHELRSPLHGILGCCELLKDTKIDNFQSNMAQTIETCGKTLLDTINHVLDFAKINSLTKGTTKRHARRSQSSRHIISPAQSHTNDIMTLITDVDLSVLTEEVLETVFAGYSFQKSATSQIYGAPTIKQEVPPIAVIVDINKSDNYVFRTQPGAWRRVLMNLFGNALKYTPAGFTKVKLEVVPSRDRKDDLAEFRLTVIDSGIGMSEDYINNRLFHSFAQENPLSQGTGLGLSIVKQIIESLGGDIEVRSRKDQGTKFTVHCPVKPCILSPADSSSQTDKEFAAIRRRTNGMTVSFVGFDTQADYFPVKSVKNKNATMLTLKALESACADWFGMRVQKFKKNTSGAPEPDLFMATESGAEWLRDQQPSRGSPMAPAIVLCQGASSAHSSPAKADRERVFECISQPCGPHKLAKALTSCLDRNENRSMMRKTEMDPRLSVSEDAVTKENMKPLSPTSIGAMFGSSPPPTKSHLSGVRPSLAPNLSAPAVPGSSSEPSKSMRPLTPRPLNCLAADDNPINLRLLRTFIDKLHHTYGLATNGREAVEAYVATASDPAKRFDVVLMDINMPEMDGLEATRQIRAHERDLGLKPVTIICLTGVASSEAQQEAHVSGVNLFLIKPVRLRELETVLNGVVIGDDTSDNNVKGDDDDKGKGASVGAELPGPTATDIAEERGKEASKKESAEGRDDLSKSNTKSSR